MRSKNKAIARAGVIVRIALTLLFALVLIEAIGPPIRNVSPSTFLPADLIGGLVKDTVS